MLDIVLENDDVLSYYIKKLNNGTDVNVIRDYLIESCKYVSENNMQIF